MKNIIEKLTKERLKNYILTKITALVEQIKLGDWEKREEYYTPGFCEAMEELETIKQRVLK